VWAFGWTTFSAVARSSAAVRGQSPNLTGSRSSPGVSLCFDCDYCCSLIGCPGPRWAASGRIPNSPPRDSTNWAGCARRGPTASRELNWSLTSRGPRRRGLNSRSLCPRWRRGLRGFQAAAFAGGPAGALVASAEREPRTHHALRRRSGSACRWGTGEPRAAGPPRGPMSLGPSRRAHVAWLLAPGSVRDVVPSVPTAWLPW
jgi:hypothetical protein